MICQTYRHDFHSRKNIDMNNGISERYSEVRMPHAGFSDKTPNSP
jgi:hypothetical protein